MRFRNFTIGAKNIDWSKAVINDLGDWIKPHLRNLWSEVTKQRVKTSGDLHTLGVSFTDPKFKEFLKIHAGEKPLAELKADFEKMGEIKTENVEKAELLTPENNIKFNAKTKLTIRNKVILYIFGSLIILYILFINIVGRVYDNTSMLRNNILFIGNNIYYIRVDYSNTSSKPELKLYYKNEYHDKIEQKFYVTNREWIRVEGKDLKLNINSKTPFYFEIFKNTVIKQKPINYDKVLEVNYEDN